MAGTSNFQQWNPAAANQENDAQYTADSMRSGGAGLDENFPSNTANKLFYQISTFVAAFAQALANKGYNVSDASLAILTGVLANVLTNADTKAPIQNVPFNPNPVFDCNQANAFEIALTGDVNASVINVGVGQVFTIIAVQDGVGGHNFNFPGLTGWQAINPAANSTTIQSFIKKTDGAWSPVPNEYVPPTPNYPALIAQTGYIKLSAIFGGLVIQWGVTPTGNPVFVNFPTAFPNACFMVVATPQLAANTSNYVWCDPPSTFGFNIYNNGTRPNACWFAIGN